jgi:cytochrome c2
MCQLKYVINSVLLIALFSSSQMVLAVGNMEGKALFKDNCKACHTVGNGKLVGPDLKDIDKKRNEAWLFKWIKSSRSMINSNDPDAVALFTEFNKVPMNEFPNLADPQIKAILEYIKDESNPSIGLASNATLPQTNEASPNQGPSLFSAPFNLLLGLIGLLLLVIYFLAQTIKRLSEQLSDFYSNDRSFF